MVCFIIIMKLYTYNIGIESNLSYAHTMRQLMSEVQKVGNQKVEWYYGNYGIPVNGVVDKGYYNVIDGTVEKPSYYPVELEKYIGKVGADAVFMHDDPQRCVWFNRLKNIPAIYWIPWDNEDWDFRGPYDVLNTCGMITTVAKFAQEKLLSQHIECNQIYNPIDTSAYKPNEAQRVDIRKQCKIPDDGVVLTWVGRPNWRKRPDLLIEVFSRALKRNPNLYLLLHTDFNNDPATSFSWKEYLYARDLLGSERVIWPNANMNYAVGVSQEEMNGMYNATDIYFSTHGGEGHGLPISEAQSCSKPFIATDTTTTQEFADYDDREGDMIGKRGIGVKVKHVFDDGGIKRPYPDLDDFVNKLDILIKDENLRKEMGKNGRKFVQKEVDKRVVGYKWKHLLNKLNVESIEIA